MKHHQLKIGSIVLVISTLIACQKLMPEPPAIDEVMDAPVNGLSHAQHKLFLEGADEFDETYTAATGLGSIFVASSCSACHAGDNKGHPSTMLTRFGQSDTFGNTFLDFGAPQIQNKALPGYEPESLPAGASFSKFIAPITAGVGYLELVPDAAILAMSDPTDANGDGISGVPNYNTIPGWVQVLPNAIPRGNQYICRFGRKASTYNLHQQTVAAFNNDMGITSTYIPKNPFNYKEALFPVPESDPEVNNQSVNATVFYLQTLQAPIQRNQNNEIVKKGAELFKSIGCESCHKETLQTGASAIAALNQVAFHPYTDLLLHNMGEELNDHYTEGTAMPSEWRTTPLWGLGLSLNAQGGQMYLLHDGRAKSIEEAILYHGGEANRSKTKFQELNQSDKQALLQFLNSL